MNWREDRFRAVSEALSEFFKQIGFKDRQISFVPCSGFTGENLVEAVTAPEASWFSGAPLVEYIGKAMT